MKRLAFLAIFLLLPQLAAGQSSTASGDVDSLPVPSWAKSVIESFNKPLHPILGGIAPGGGIGVGIGYTTPRERRVFRDASAQVTVNRYWSIDGEAGVRSPRSQIGAFGEIRHMNRLDYYGLGPNSLRQDRADFRLRETVLGARGWLDPVPAFRVGGSASVYAPDLGEGSHPKVPGIAQVFADRVVPGLDAEPVFGRYRGYARIVYPVVNDATAQDGFSGGYRSAYQVSLEAVRDHDAGQYNFHRWETEIKQRIPGIRAGHHLTLHGLVGATNPGSEVPFYMLYTLGGSSGLKAFLPELLGTDGSRATLRSFRNFRFRDRSLLLMQAEYRIPLMDAVHATVFVDAGQVAPRVSDLFGDVRTGTGFSLSYMRKGVALGRVDVGYGRSGGLQVFWSMGGFGL